MTVRAVTHQAAVDRRADWSGSSSQSNPPACVTVSWKLTCFTRNRNPPTPHPTNSVSHFCSSSSALCKIVCIFNYPGVQKSALSSMSLSIWYSRVMTQTDISWFRLLRLHHDYSVSQRSTLLFLGADWQSRNHHRYLSLSLHSLTRILVQQWGFVHWGSTLIKGGCCFF